MKYFFIFINILLLFKLSIKDSFSSEHLKPRVIATTDGELDDQSSMVRFLMYACDYDIAGIVQVNGVQKDGHSKDKWIEALIAKYNECLPNLKIHNPDYPDADYLLSVLKVGNENRNDLGKSPTLLSDSEGAQLIIATLLDNDPRPVHILSWGGANTTANALWQIKNNRSAEEYLKAAAKARLYCIWYQDGGGKWIENNLPEIKIYEAGADPQHDGSWRYVWDYMSVDLKYKGRMSKNPKELQVIMDTPWLSKNIKYEHGPLAASYPQDYTSEGDTPSFMPLINNGLEMDVDYTLGGWGGRPVYKNGNHMVDGGDENNGKEDFHYTFQRWLPAAQNDWAARADWCISGSYSDANHQPIAAITGEAIGELSPGQLVVLDASPSTDPDNNVLSYSWWQYFEADNAKTKLNIENNTSMDKASFITPDEPGKQLHVILEVTDNGVPALTSYKRLIFNISKASEIKSFGNTPVKIYPNPANNILNIDFSNSKPGIKTTEVINNNGCLLIRKETSNEKTSIEIGSLNPGIYFVITRDKNDQTISKFIKN